MGDAEEVVVEMPEAAAPQKAVAVPPQVMQEVLDVLTTELPMKRVRGLVQALESCPLLDVSQGK